MLEIFDALVEKIEVLTPMHFVFETSVAIGFSIILSICCEPSSWGRLSISWTCRAHNEGVRTILNWKKLREVNKAKCVVSLIT